MCLCASAAGIRLLNHCRARGGPPYCPSHEHGHHRTAWEPPLCLTPCLGCASSHTHAHRAHTADTHRTQPQRRNVLLHRQAQSHDGHLRLADFIDFIDEAVLMRSSCPCRPLLAMRGGRRPASHVSDTACAHAHIATMRQCDNAKMWRAHAHTHTRTGHVRGVLWCDVNRRLQRHPGSLEGRLGAAMVARAAATAARAVL